MAAIDKAIAAVKAHGPLVRGGLKEFAEKYDVNRSTLGRRLRGQTRSKKEGYESLRKLTPSQELELVNYIKGLSVKGLAPTRQMVQNFAGEVGHIPVSLKWVDSFLHRHQLDLTSKWTTGMDAVRHLADSGVKYRLYFDLLHSKMDEYDIDIDHVHNMDEKGFMPGLLGRSKRIFSKEEWEKGRVKESLQDGNRSWITCITCICANGEALPPALIYLTTSGDIQSTWVAALKPNNSELFITSSPTGWSNDEIGLA